MGRKNGFVSKDVAGLFLANIGEVRLQKTVKFPPNKYVSFVFCPLGMAQSFCSLCHFF